jgi:hypothetical protein
MRIVIIAAALFLCVFAWPTAGARAAQGWCSISGEGYSNCGFATAELCRASISGNGGYCMPPVASADLHGKDVYTRPTSKKDDQFDAVMERANRKSKVQLCRGC